MIHLYRNLILAGLLAGGLAFASVAASDLPDISYKVESIRGKLIQELANSGRRLEEGQILAGGETLRTGWFSESELSAPSIGTRFHLGSRTRVVLASERPGVILAVEEGRVRALFDRLLGDDASDRVIETPSALLAVRGTEYGVSVDRKGSTLLVVFSGGVDVQRTDDGAAPTRVEAGFSLHIQPGQEMGMPSAHSLSPMGWDHGGMPSMHDSPMSPGMDGMSGGEHGMGSSSGQQRMGGGGHGG